MTCEMPGTKPNRKPITVPRPIGPADALRSVHRGTRLFSVGLIVGFSVASCSKLSRISLMPKSPSAIATKLMPSAKCSDPNV